MPVITKLKFSKNRKDVLVFFGKKLHKLTADIVINNGLKVGLDLDLKKLTSFLKETKKNNAYLKSLNLISYKPRARGELETRLKQKNFDPEETKIALDKLENQGYIDDLTTAISLANSYANRFDGPNKIRYKLKTKKLKKDSIEAAIRQVYPDQESQLKAAQAALQKKRINQKDIDIKVKNKIYSYLSGKGFESLIINQILNDQIDF